MLIFRAWATCANTNLAYLQLHQVFPRHRCIHDLLGDPVVQVPLWLLVYLSCLAYPKKKKMKSRQLFQT